MTLIRSPAPLTPLYPYPCINTQTTEQHSYSIARSAGLSWLQLPATAPAPSSSSAAATSQKYRTLASIQSQTRHQQCEQHLANILGSTSSPASPISPSIKPNPLDSLPLTTPHTPTPHQQTLADAHHISSPSSITSAIQEMDSTHGTCFLTWIHNPANLDYISLRLRPLCLEYPLVDVANVLRWIGADWTSADCKALFRAITQSWDQSKRRMLAFLLIRDEEMRQKAKSKLVEYAQKSRAKSQQQQQQHLWRRSQQHQNQQPQQLGGIQGNQLHQQLHKVQSTAASAAIVDVGSVGAIVDTATPTATTTTASTDSGSWGDLKTLEDIVAASIISGIDMTIPSESIAPHASLRQHRFSPY